MKKAILLTLLAVTISMFYGCKKTAITTAPLLSTSPVSNVALTSATDGGDVTSDGNSPVIARGVCWSTALDPMVTDSKTEDGSGTGQFVSVLSGLTPGITYFVRAYATNSDGTDYGNEISFTTITNSLQVPDLTTTNVTSITATTAVSGGNITSDNGSAVTARGVCWATTTGPTIAGSFTTDGAGSGSFISNLTGLAQGTLYYIRAYATNSTGTAYGNEITFTTTSVQQSNEIYIQEDAFSPVTLTVSVNTTVKWTNKDPVTHTVTSDTAGLFNSGSIIPGSSYSFQFTSPGTYTYHCTIHTFMTGTVIVQ
jgi:plastocyanin